MPTSESFFTTWSGMEFHKRKAVGMKPLSSVDVLTAGKDRAWSGMDKLERGTLPLSYGGGKDCKSTGQLVISMHFVQDCSGIYMPPMTYSTTYMQRTHQIQ